MPGREIRIRERAVVERRVEEKRGDGRPSEAKHAHGTKSAERAASDSVRVVRSEERVPITFADKYDGLAPYADVRAQRIASAAKALRKEHDDPVAAKKRVKELSQKLGIPELAADKMSSVEVIDAPSGLFALRFKDSKGGALDLTFNPREPVANLRSYSVSWTKADGTRTGKSFIGKKEHDMLTELIRTLSRRLVLSPKQAPDRVRRVGQALQTAQLTSMAFDVNAYIGAFITGIREWLKDRREQTLYALVLAAGDAGDKR